VLVPIAIGIVTFLSSVQQLQLQTGKSNLPKQCYHKPFFVLVPQARVQVWQSSLNDNLFLVVASANPV
jgi:hypothetical protein